MRSYHGELIGAVVVLFLALRAYGYNGGSAWRNERAFAALKEDGTVAVWGYCKYGGSTTDNSIVGGYSGVPTGLNDVRAIYSTSEAYAALKKDGTVAVWGLLKYGGSTKDYMLSNTYVGHRGLPANLKDVVSISSTDYAFAALKGDGTVEVWGSLRFGGSNVSTSEAIGLPSELKNVETIFSNHHGFVALRGDGSVMGWGSRDGGQNVVPPGLRNVKTIYSSIRSFAALRQDGTVETWGERTNTGASLRDVVTIYSNYDAFAALHRDGQVSVWGDPDCGGEDAQLPAGLEDVTAIYSTEKAFAALKGNGSVVVWGSKGDGGSTIDGHITSPIPGHKGPSYTGMPSGLSNVRTIYSTKYAFAALRWDGTVAVWGMDYKGGSTTGDTATPGGYTGLPASLNDVVDISSTNTAFAALKKDGTVAVWGDVDRGGGRTDDTSNVHKYSGVPAGLKDVTAIYSNSAAFTALKKDGTLEVWGSFSSGGSKADDGSSYNQYTGLPSITPSNGVKAVFGSTRLYSDSTARGNYPCPPGSYGPGMPNCTACPSSSSSSAGAYGFETGIRSTIGSCVTCDTADRKYSTDGLSCSHTCGSGYIYSPPTLVNSGFPTCRRCRYLGEYYDEARSACAPCAKGKTGDRDFQCQPCGRGTYASAEGQSGCSTTCPPDSSVPGGIENVGCFRSICPSGSYGKVGDVDSCHDCPTGKFANETGLDTCYVCPAGKYAKEAASSCIPCAAGSYRSEPNGADCGVCFPGTFSEGEGSVTCRRCVDAYGIGFGTDGASNSTSCVFEGCDAGSRVNRSESSGKEVGCVLCSVGRYSSEKNSEQCAECPGGTYSNETGSAQCTACEIGKYNEFTGAASADNCTACEVGKYNSFAGSAACQPCPPGSLCNKKGMARATECPVGAASLKKESEECSACVAGRYQSEVGSAACELCPAGKYSATNSSISNATCALCDKGKFSSQAGASVCTSCAKGSFQDAEGQTACKVCTEAFDDETLTSNAAGDGCEENAELQSLSVVGTIYSYGTVWVGAVLIASLFVAAVMLVTYFREKEPTRLANFSRAEAAYYSFLPGFSFGSWVFLVFTVAADDTILAVVMSLSRLLHLVGGILIVLVLFGPQKYSARLGRASSASANELSKLRKYLDGEFARENVYIVEMVSLLSFCDVTMLRFIPWKKSKLYTLSEGYPSLTLMNFCLIIKTVETFVSVMCDVVYLWLYSDSDGVSNVQRQQTQALFILNIIFGVATIVMDLLVLCVRRGVLAELKETPSSSSDGAEEGTAAGAGAVASSDVDSFSLADMYEDRSGMRDGSVAPTENPLHSTAGYGTGIPGAGVRPMESVLHISALGGDATQSNVDEKPAVQRIVDKRREIEQLQGSYDETKRDLDERMCSLGDRKRTLDERKRELEQLEQEQQEAEADEAGDVEGGGPSSSSAAMEQVDV